MPGTLSQDQRSFLRTEAAAFFRAALAGVDPAALVPKHIYRQGRDVEIRAGDGSIVARLSLPLVVVGAGKAAPRMACAVEQCLGADAVRGLVVGSAPIEPPPRSIEVAVASHPLPDQRGVEATSRIMATVAGAEHNVLCLVSGGASSLLVAPRPPLTLADKIAINQLLLASGCTIDELNTVRKHLSLAKGGGLLALCPATMVTLILSDVIGDDLATIGSGPTVADPTTFEDAWDVIVRYQLQHRAPAAVLEVLQRGRQGLLNETLKPRQAEQLAPRHLLIGSNRLALTAAADAARRRGWDVVLEPAPLQGDTVKAARQFSDRVLSLSSNTASPGVCLLAGGETTVQVQGTGVGGRNQEFALAMVGSLDGRRALVLSAGSDGIDGPTSAAGAFVDGTSLDRARQLGLDPSHYLADNDSHSFFENCGDLFKTGPTGTNVMDLKIALVPR